MALLIDTSVFIAVERSGQAPESLLERLGAEPVSLSAMTASELLHGVHRADGAVRRGRRERFVERLLLTIPVLPFTLEVARIHSRLWADLQKRGEMIGAHDLVIAATALTHDMTVLTGDQRHFGRIETLKVSLW
ncbi:MAG: type II toxin-antitoxin system VapC family toxin [Thermoanaerobaculia bacterium]